MKIDNPTFGIHITNEDPTKNAQVLAFNRYKRGNNVRKTKEGKTIASSTLALHSPENDFIKSLKNDEDLLETFMERDEEVNLELTGKRIARTSTILLTSDEELCYNFTEYEIKKDRKGNVIPCEQCDGVYCEHRIKNQIYGNVNSEESPISWIKSYMLDKRDALRDWSFDRSYQIVHTNGLTYDFLYKIAEKLHKTNKVVFVAPIIDKKPEKLVIRTGQLPFYGWLEGRIEGDKYALILHGTTFKISG